MWLANIWLEEQLGEQTAADALDGRDGQEDAAEAGHVCRVQEVHHLPEGRLSLRLKASDGG